MGVNIDSVINDIKFDQKLISIFNTYNKYINFRFDYVIRTSLSQLPDELHHNIDYSLLDYPNQKFLSACIDNDNGVNNISMLREELKTLTTEVDLKKKEINMTVLNEEGLRKNIKHLEDIISIKENFIRETASYANIRCNAKDKVQKEYYKTNKKYDKILSLLNKSRKSMKTNASNSSKNSEYIERLQEKALKYEAKIKKMNEVIKIAGDSKEKLEQYQIALKTSKDRLNIFYDQLNNQLKNKQELTVLVIENEKRILQLKANLSNLGVLSSVERSRVHTSSNLIEDNSLKKEFIELQKMRDEVLSSRPKGIFNPKYQKEKSLTKDEIRKYLENDEAIGSIDYLIELKNSEVHCSNTNLLKYIQINSDETNIFLKCLSNLSVDEIKKLLIHYFIKVVDLKEAGRENDELICKLDEVNDRQRHSIISLNNSYQEFHLSIEKKFMALKKYYQEKINMLFELFQEENNAITVFKMRQEITSLKKKIIELEKLQMVKPKETLGAMHDQHISLDRLDASKSGSETVSSAKVTCHKNKLKIQKNKSK